MIESNEAVAVHLVIINTDLSLVFPYSAIIMNFT